MFFSVEAPRFPKLGTTGGLTMAEVGACPSLQVQGLDVNKEAQASPPCALGLALHFQLWIFTLFLSLL